MILWNFIKDHMLEKPTQLISENEANLSYEKMIIWAEEFAKKLSNVKCCAILCSSEMAAGMSLLACFAAEVTAVPLSIRYGETHCNKILDAISPDAIIMDTGGELAIYKLTDNQFVVPDKHPALIMCTSGTTGAPKGSLLSENNVVTNVTDISDYFDMKTSDSILISRPLYHCAVLTGEFLTALVKGARIRFCSDPFNPTKLLNLIDKYQITTFCGTPTILSILARCNFNSKTKTLKNICISGECMGKKEGQKIAEAFPNCQIYHVYGLTEACPRVSYLPPEFFCDYSDCVGIPLKSVSIKIQTPDGTECRKNEEGVLYVKGDNIMIGYYGDPERTQIVLREGWLCTGDVAVINEAGFLKIKGRVDDMIIKAGMNIYPAEIEQTLKQNPRVKEALAFEYRNRFGTQIGLKVVGDFSSVDEVKRYCVDHLPLHQIPSKIELVTELPKSGSGKIIRRL